MTENELSKIVIDLGFKIHRKLGAGLFESVYEECLFYELKKSGLNVEKQKTLSIIYEELRIENAFRLDLIVESKLVLEIKTVDFINEIHIAHLLTYLKMTGCHLGLVLIFRTPLFKDGIISVVNGF